MKIYRLKGSKELYILSYKFGRFLGRQLQAAPYSILSRQQTGPWEDIPVSKALLFEKAYEI